MAKLSRKINAKNSEEKKENKLKYTLSTKKNTEKNKDKTISDKNIEKNNTQSPIFNLLPDNENELKHLLRKELENIDFSPLAHQNIDKENDINFTKQIIDKILNYKIVSKTAQYIKQFEETIKNLENENKKLNDKIKKIELYNSNLKAQLSDSEENLFRIEKKYNNAIIFSDLSKIFVTEKIKNDISQKIKQILDEVYIEEDKKSEKFAIYFLKGFVWIENAIENATDDEKENIKIFDNAGRKLLEEISNKNSTQRRNLLNLIAELFNIFLKEYNFISPEQTLQIDTSIHNANGIGGTLVKEGISFAVVRRDTQKTFLFAEIKTK